MKSVTNSMPSSSDAVKATEAMNTLYRLALRKQQRYRTLQVVHIHRTSCRSVWPRGFGELNPSPHSWIRFTSVSPQVAQKLSVLAPIYLLPLWSKYRSPVQNLSDMWRSTFVIGAALRSITEIAPRSPLLCVNRSPIWYNFHTGAKAIWYRVNMAKT